MLVSNSPTLIVAPLLGTNLGSVVMIVLPCALWGISSKQCFFSYSSVILGTTRFSMKRLINVDFPVLTAPTTPKYISPLPRFAIEDIIFSFSITHHLSLIYLMVLVKV